MGDMVCNGGDLKKLCSLEFVAWCNEDTMGLWGQYTGATSRVLAETFAEVLHYPCGAPYPKVFVLSIF